MEARPEADAGLSERRRLPAAEREVWLRAAAGDFSAYDRVVVAFSGGKDSLACVLKLLELGCPKSKMELWHHDIDGAGGRHFMDWPVTRAYCRAVAEELGLRIKFSWKEGGFEGEMLRNERPTAPTSFELDDGTIRTVGGKGPNGTRRKFPQVSADLKVRWCSAYLKIDVGARVMCNDPAFKTGRFLFVTGERREESSARSRYPEVERGKGWASRRLVHHWRAVIDWTEAEVWAAIKAARIAPHPAYRLGFGRLSCMACIFGDKDQWAAVRELDPERFEKIARYEEEFGCTIKRKHSVRELEATGTSYCAGAPAELKRAAMAASYELPILDTNWKPPAGAFKKCCGPS